jgi:hypothetical protein
MPVSCPAYASASGNREGKGYVEGLEAGGPRGPGFFTTAYRKIRETTFPSVDAGIRDLTLDMKDARGIQLSNGGVLPVHPGRGRKNHEETAHPAVKKRHFIVKPFES